jgi:hypothetical protein
MKMHTDFTVPKTEYDYIDVLPVFCLVLNPEAGFAKSTNLTSSFKLNVFSDDDFLNDCTEEKNILTSEYYDVIYLRDTRLRNITKKEWDTNYGAKNVSQYKNLHHLKNKKRILDDEIVKVICLKKISYDLNDLNHGYKNPKKYGR